MEINPRHLRWALLVVCLIALLARLLVLTYIGNNTHKFYSADTKGYVLRAKNLMTQGVFSGKAQAPFTPDTIRTPGYPVFLAANFALFGEFYPVIILEQIIFGCLTVLLTFVLAQKLQAPNWAALIAALIVAVDPISILLANRLLTENPFTFVLLASIWFLTLFLYDRWAEMLIFSTAAIIVATFIRPIAQFLPVALFPVFLLMPKRKSLRPALVGGTILLLVSGIVVSAWAYRNYRLTNLFTVSSISDVNLFYYRARAVMAEAENLNPDEAKTRLETEINTTVAAQGLTLTEKTALERRRALEIFSQHPGLTLTMLTKGALRLLLDPGFTIICTELDLSNRSYDCIAGQSSMLNANVVTQTIDTLRGMNLLQIFTLAWSTLLLGIIYLGLVIGVFRLLRERQWLPLALLLGIIAYFILLSAGGETNYRFRAPIVPFLAILAGVGLGSLRIRWLERYIMPTLENAQHYVALSYAKKSAILNRAGYNYLAKDNAA